MHRRFLTALILAVPTALSAQEEKTAFFENRIRPVLVSHCYECHSAGAKKLKGGLFLDSRTGWETGGDSGPAIVPGQPQESLLYAALAHNGDAPEMPPKEKLPAAVVEDFRRWIADGATDPRSETAAKPGRTAIDLEAGRRFWSFQPPRKTYPPTVRDDSWPRGPIDRFILAKQETAGLKPATDAEPRTLIRRLSFDLTGLPPTPERIDSFLSAWEANPDAAISTATDEWLASPEFGEKWARHWLDLARYADSNGGDINLTYTNAWRYRNWVVGALNHDLPYDEFVRQQIAGDLLSGGNDADSLIATGFLIVGPKMLSERDKEKMHLDVADDQIDTVGRAILGLTLGCARCHDHKFDPVPTADYYAMAGIFRGTRTAEGVRMNNVNVSGWIERDLPGMPDQKAMAAQDRPEKEIADLAIRVRGETTNLGPVEPRGFLRVASAAGTARPTIAKNESGRRELADWLAGRDNPLTARVLVNRLWAHLFDAGLVRTVDNFGTQGDAPSHPELLDWLAVEFMDHGWSMKRAIRQIVLSRTYRLSSPGENDALPAADPANRLLTHQNRRRLTGEAIRDALLTASGQWDARAAGSPVSHLGEQAIPNSTKQDGAASQNDHRGHSLYLPMVRGDMPAFLEVFDLANPDVATGERPVTTVPDQALLMMNAPFVREMAAATVAFILAEEEPSEGRIDANAAIGALYLSLLGRQPSEYEAANARAFVAELEAEESLDEEGALASFAKTLIGSTEFRFLE